MENLSKYYAFSSNAIKEKYAYRFKAIMWALSTTFNMLIQYFLWWTIYSETEGSFLGVDEKNYLAYIAFGVIFYNMTYCMENMNIAEDIKSGNICMNMLKPFNYKIMVLFRHIGSKIGEVIGLIPIFIVVCLMIGQFNIKFSVIICFILSSILAFFISFIFSYIIGMITFWTTNYWGVQFLVGSLSGIFSGQMLAINFYTELGKGATTLASVLPFLDYDKLTVFFRALGIMAYCLPFQSMYYTPMSILTGIIDTPEKIIFHIMLQVMWLIVLNFIADIMWKVAQKKITILGG
ncbi:ABC-2 family transporter protein [uncultured Clostridium sp.]|uniref:ABC transporter permease n=1 Tax=uncultured Clostridium sp. TaxID=59620 RepID=UPI0025DD6CE0|nr:ABC-2 family transporter protein [uncultured Clostridium sp.]